MGDWGGLGGGAPQWFGAEARHVLHQRFFLALSRVLGLDKAAGLEGDAVAQDAQIGRRIMAVVWSHRAVWTVVLDGTKWCVPLVSLLVELMVRVLSTSAISGISARSEWWC